MEYRVWLTDSAKADIGYFEARDQRIIVAGILTHLQSDAETPSRRKKKLRPNPIAPWVLRVETFRVFYVVEKGDLINVVAVGKKDHNDLLVQGKKIEL